MRRQQKKDKNESSSECCTDSEAEIESYPISRAASREGLLPQEDLRQGALLPLAAAASAAPRSPMHIGSFIIQPNSADEYDAEGDDDILLTDVEASSIKEVSYNWINDDATLPGRMNQSFDSETPAELPSRQPYLRNSENGAAARSDATLRPSTALPEATKAKGSTIVRPASALAAPVPSSCSKSNVSKVQDQILFAQAEVNRLERLLKSVNKGKSLQPSSSKTQNLPSNPRKGSQNEIPETESDTLYGVLTSPRDKPAKRRPGTGSSRPGSRRQGKKNVNAWA